MTGNDLKNKIKALNLTQEVAASKLGITRATLSNWCKQAELSNNIVKIVKTNLGIEADTSDSSEIMLETIRSQQNTIVELTSIIKNLTSK